MIGRVRELHTAPSTRMLELVAPGLGKRFKVE